jgi:metallo-beta-lactamase family protein
VHDVVQRIVRETAEKGGVVEVQALSAHADYRELLDWLAARRLSPRRAFVTHGEPAAADAFRRRLKETFGWDVVVPEMGAAFALG